MADTTYPKRQGAIARRIRHIRLQNKRLRELVADLPFNKIILLQEIWEREHHESRPRRSVNDEGRR